ncbi:TonB-dependent receptor, partial [Helicobacter muridarum]
GNGKLLADTYELGATWGYTFNISLKYEMDNFDVAWFSRFVTGFKDGTQGFNIYQREFEDIGKEGYTISDVHFNYYPLGKDKLTLRFSILNIFNQFYVDPTSPLKVEADNSKSESINQVRAALYEPGTDYRIEVRYRF